VKAASIPANEAERLRALERYGVLDSGAEAAFDEITRLAAQICDTPIALVNFIDSHRQWTKAKFGWEAPPQPRELSICAHTILQPDILVVGNLGQDERFQGHPLVSAEPGIRFYAGAPLISLQGHAIGTLSVLDNRPRRLTQTQLDALTSLGRQVITHLELRVHVNELEREAASHQRTEDALRQAEAKYRGIFENVVEGIFQTTPDGHYIAANPMLAKIYGFASPEALIASVGDISKQLYVDPNRRAEFARLMAENGVISNFESQTYRADGSIIWISENARAVRDGQGNLLYYEGTVEDITARKQAEETLRFSEMRLRSVWENSSDGMRLTDPSGVILAVNPSFCRIVDLPEEELLGRPFTVVYREEPEQEARLKRYRERFATQSIDTRLERQLTFRSGKTANLELSNSFLQIDGKEPVLLCIFHDITVRKRAEEALRESEILYHSLVENLPQNIFRKDAQERFTFANNRFCETLGKPLADIIGRTDFDFFPTEFAEKYQRDDQRVMQTGKSFETIEAYQAPDGKHYVQVVKTPLYDPNGKVMGIQGMFYDVTERKKTEEQLAFERDLLRALLDHVPDRIYFKDTDSKFLRCSLAMGKRLGLDDPEQVVGKTDFDFHPKDKAKEFFDDEQRIILTGQPLINKVEEQTGTDGKKIWASVTKVPTRNRAGSVTGIIGISRDISALKRAEEQLAVARDAALESARLKSEFLATVSHEIRTPMNGIIGMTGLLLETSLDEQQKDFAETIHSSAETLLNIINDILDFSKIEAGRLTFETIDFDLRDVAEETMELLAHRAHAKGVELACLIPEDVPTALRGDPVRIRQILMNLVGNAVKFTERGEVVMRIESQGEAEDSVALQIEVKDTGIGIAPEMQARVFSAFTQADGSTTRKYGGTGLGLSISKQLVELMGGDIGMHSQPKQGSTFWFNLLLAKQPQPATKPVSTMEKLTGVHVLIVDDNETSRRILEYQATAWRMHPVGAATATEALGLMRNAAVKGVPFSVAIIDMAMPEVDGLTLVQEIKSDAQLAATQVVLLSLMSHRIDSEMLATLNVAACIYKPVKHFRLLDCLATVLAGGIFLPQHQPSTAATLTTMAGAPAVGSVARIRLLVAEDNAVNQKVARLVLQKIGYHADFVTNGEEVLIAVRRQPYDAILMDCQMPVMDGYEATRHLRELEQRSATHPDSARPIQIIALTANALQSDRERCLAAGMNEYISKPIQPVELDALLRRRQPNRPPAHPAAAPAIDGVDYDPGFFAGLRSIRTPDTPDPVAELVDLFLTDTADKLRQAHEAAENKDAKALAAAVHSLKGSANNLGAKKFARLCAALETDAKAGIVKDAVTALSQVEVEFERLKEMLVAEKQK
jgi:two-component system sensor histidine kinase/response regulator